MCKVLVERIMPLQHQTLPGARNKGSTCYVHSTAWRGLTDLHCEHRRRFLAAFERLKFDSLVPDIFALVTRDNRATQGRRCCMTHIRDHL